MNKWVALYIKTCEKFQRVKPSGHTSAPLQSLPECHQQIPRTLRGDTDASSRLKDAMALAMERQKEYSDRNGRCNIIPLGAPKGTIASLNPLRPVAGTAPHIPLASQRQWRLNQHSMRGVVSGTMIRRVLQLGRGKVQSKVQATREFLLRQEAFLKVAQDRMSEAQERMKYYYDRNRLVQDFKTGDMVLLDGKNLDIRHKGYAQSKKLAPRFIGPFPVQKKVSRDSYELGLSKNLKLHPVFHTSLLKPYRKDPKRRQKMNKVVLADGTEGQLVEAVINHRKRKGKM
ncbi:Hypothetical protein PHPALM_4456, partial [Phytophthora palmivora]